MALHLTAKDLRRDAAEVGREALTPAGVASASALVANAVVNAQWGAQRTFAGLAGVGGGIFLAARKQGPLKHIGLGTALGSMWALFGGPR